MASRSDQAEAYRAGWRRLLGGFLGRDGNAPDPTRRPMRTLFAGVVAGLLVMVGTAGWRFLSPGSNTAWRKPGTLVVEKGTGSRYVFYGGRLHPVLNVASAILLEQSSLTVATVSASALSTVPRGLSVGIPGAPDAIPSAAQLVANPWTVCSSRLSGGGQDVTVVVGAQHRSGALSASQGVLVSAGSHGDFLLWQGHRLAVGGSAVLGALGYAETTPTRVAPSWLGLVPPGPALRAPSVPDLGAGFRRPIGDLVRVGQVGKVQSLGAPTEYFVLLPSGLAPVSEFVAALLLADPAVSQAAYQGAPPRAIPIHPATYAGAPKSQAPLAGTAGLPSRIPTVLPAAAPILCATSGSASGAGAVQVAAASTLPLPAGGQATTLPASSGNQVLADAVYVPPGRGCLIRLTGGIPAGESRTQLVTESGVRFPVVGIQALQRLGYSRAATVSIPAAVAGLLPQGPALSTAAARQTWAVPPTGQ